MVTGSGIETGVAEEMFGETAREHGSLEDVVADVADCPVLDADEELRIVTHYRREEGWAESAQVDVIAQCPHEMLANSGRCSTTRASDGRQGNREYSFLSAVVPRRVLLSP